MSVSFVLERLPAPSRHDPASIGNIKRQRVYILPTREGFVFSILLLAMLFGAMNYNNNLAFILTFLLGGLFLVCILHTHRNLAGLIIRGSRPQPVFAGAAAQFPISIDNHHGHARTALRLVCQPRRKWRGEKPTPALHATVEVGVQTGQNQHLHITLPAMRRGLLPLERIIISSCFPLGLFRAWSYLEIEQHCLVYPRPEGRAQLPAPMPGAQQGQAGAHNGTNDFIGFRQYHPGDSTRTIAWKAVARGHPLLVKRFSGDGSHTLLLHWEDVNHLHDTEARLSQLCRWLLVADQQGWEYGLSIPDAHIAPDRGHLHKETCLEALAKFGNGHAGNG